MIDVKKTFTRTVPTVCCSGVYLVKMVQRSGVRQAVFLKNVFKCLGCGRGRRSLHQKKSQRRIAVRILDAFCFQNTESTSDLVHLDPFFESTISASACKAFTAASTVLGSSNA